MQQSIKESKKYIIKLQDLNQRLLKSIKEKDLETKKVQQQYL
jgi:hypothetical protein